MVCFFQNYLMNSKSKGKRPIVDDDCDGTQIKRQCTNGSIPNPMGCAWINYFRIEAQRVKEVDSTTKVDMQVRREIAGRWYDLSPEEKSEYRFPNDCVVEDTTEVVEDLVVVDPKASFMTRCSPERFSAVISTFSEEQNQAVEELGFGSLLTMRCGRLRRELCAWLVDQFDPLTLSIDLHGVKFNLSPKVFTNIMGIRDGGGIVQLSGSADGIIMEMRSKFCTTSRGIPMTEVAEYLRESSYEDKEFKIRFTLFALGTLLCPSSGTYLTPSILYPLEDVNSIHTKNWATWSFNCLVDGILKFKQTRQQYVSGCVLFLELFYFNCVAFKQPSVNKSLLPISAWKEGDIRKFMRLLLRHGGIGSPTVPIQQSQGIMAAVSSEVKVVKNDKQLDDCVHDIMIIKREINLMKERVSSVCAKFDSSEVVMRDLKLIKEMLSSLCSNFDSSEASMAEEEQDIMTKRLKGLCDRPLGEGKEPLSTPSPTKRCMSSDPKNNLSFICKICTESKTINESFSIQGCSHTYCMDCIVKYVASKLQDNITSICCPVPDCRGVLEPDYCRNILPQEVFDRWGNALCEAVILGAQKFYCPFKDCSALLIDDGGEIIREPVCPNCSRIFCAQCKVLWHVGIECEEFQKLNKDEREHEDIMLMNLAQNENWKRCPDCRYYVEKKDGCMYMKCRCGCAFCYNCGARATATTHLCPSC